MLPFRVVTTGDRVRHVLRDDSVGEVLEVRRAEDADFALVLVRWFAPEFERPIWELRADLVKLD